MRENGNNIKQQLREYKKKYYLNILIKGVIFSLLWISITFLAANSIEFLLRLNSVGRAMLFVALIGVFAFSMIQWVLKPIIVLFNNKQQISDEEAAKQIGQYFPEVKDKLLNVLQLSSLPNASEALIKAGIEQKTKEISYVPFSSAIDLKINLRYLRLLAIPFLAIGLILIVFPAFVTESTSRIVQYSKEFIPEAPFRFFMVNENLEAFKNEDFTVELNLDGNAVPDQAYLIVNERRIKMSSTGAKSYQHTFTRVQDNFKFRFEAAGFESQSYELEVIRRPSLGLMEISLLYPKYIGKESETFKNSGNLKVPEGTDVVWNLETGETDSLTFTFDSDKQSKYAEKEGRENFLFSKKMRNNDRYSIELKNDKAANADPIQYRIEVIKDQFPDLSIQQYVDTTLYSFIVFGGSVSDDYGLTSLKLKYKKEREENYTSVDIPINTTQKDQNLYYQFDTDSLNLSEGSKLEYYLEAYDNDGVNGIKSTKTPVFVMSIPDKAEIKEILDRTAEGTQNETDNAAKEAKEVNEMVEEIERRLKGKRNLDWQDQQAIEQLFEKRQSLDNQIEKMQEQAKENEQMLERFGPENEKLREKMEMVQKLMDEVLDEETKKLYDELRKLLEENKNINQVQSLMNQISEKEKNLEKELDRTLELFKRLKYEMKAEEAIQSAEELAKKQEELKEETEAGEKAEEDLLKEQQDLKEEFESLKEQLDEMKEFNEQLKQPDDLSNTEELEEEIGSEMEQSEQKLQNKDKQGSQQNQQKASESLQKLAQSLTEMQESNQMEMQSENIASLRTILNNLIKLSFEQETLLKDFKEVQSTDPRYMELAAVQLELKTNSKVLQDSLQALSSRVFQLSSFINRELTELNRHFDGSLEALKERRTNQSVGRQEFAMTSMNNLALMLDDLLKQLQNPPTGGGQGGQSNSKGNKMSLSELQKQLSEQINEIKKSGMEGRQLSEELAKMAAEQEKLRRMMQEMQGQTMDGELAQEIQDIIKEMEQNEVDLVNKNIGDELLERQNPLNTRLLDAENAMREDQTDDERKGEEAGEYEKPAPKLFEEYLRAKEKEIELLRTIPPKLNPYYKNEVNEYFKRINK